MNRINRKIDEFCYQHPGFGIPNLMKIIVIGTVVVYLLYLLTGYNASSIQFLTFNLNSLLHGEIWRLVTFIFVPTNFSPFWLLISLFSITLSAAPWAGVGHRQIQHLLFRRPCADPDRSCGRLPHHRRQLDVKQHILHQYVHVFAFAMLYPDATVLLLILPVKIKWLAWLDAALFAFDIVAALAQLNFVSALLPIVALLNFFLFSAKHFWAGCAAPPAGRHIRPLQNHSL